MKNDKKIKIAYCTPSLYIAGGVERVLTTKANYLADVEGHEITIILTDGKGKEPYYTLSPKIKIINLDINFEELWHRNFIEKSFIYLIKQAKFKKELTRTLMSLRPNITVSLMRREINFITSIKDGSKKIGEMHVNKDHYRNYEGKDRNIFKSLFSKLWMYSLVKKIKKLDKFIVLSNEDKNKWGDIKNIMTIYNPITLDIKPQECERKKQVLAVGRYVYQKGFDLLIYAWAKVTKKHPDWTLKICGEGDRNEYETLIKKLDIEKFCILEGPANNISEKYYESSIFVLSSRFEGFGLVLAEAMSCGTPCVSFDCPSGPSEIITDNVDGLIAKSGNINDLAEKISMMIENKEMRNKMGEQALINSNKFHKEVIMQQWIELFETIN